MISILFSIYIALNTPECQLPESINNIEYTTKITKYQIEYRLNDHKIVTEWDGTFVGAYWKHNTDKPHWHQDTPATRVLGGVYTKMKYGNPVSPHLRPNICSINNQ